MRLVTLDDDGADEEIPEDEEWLLSYREKLFSEIRECGERARLLEYLIYRHIPDALYDGRVEERCGFVFASFKELTDKWDKTDGTLGALVEICRAWSYDVEYDEDELEKRIAFFEKNET